MLVARSPLAAWRTCAVMVVAGTLLAACTERPPRFDVPPPSLAPRYTVLVTVNGTPSLTTPMGPGMGVFGGALAGGYYACVLSYGALCAAAPIVMPLTAAVGLANAETPRNISRAERGLKRQEITSRVNSRLHEALLRVGNQRRGYRFVAADTSTAIKGTSIALSVTALTVGLTQGGGKQVFTLHVEGRLEKQDLGEYSYQSAPREVAQWLSDDGATVDAALTESCRSIAEQMVTRALVGR
ncbi:MAG: hypothetical protein K2Y51_24975 [Gammaproteobacteria bacterium]|jgi:hypothetical protein|nr:hypothetical protein [Gammaproteobacteria bacterium]